MIWTGLAFVLLTVLCITVHVRRSHCVPANGAAVSSRRCPKCRTENPEGAPLCPGCGVPQQIFELATAPLARAAKADDGAPKIHAVVRADQCVGCGACISACPEPGALKLEGKLAVVDLDLCKGLGKCESACPVTAIAVGTGAGARLVEAPRVGPDFQTNVKGVYLVGELGGRGLIRNAVNEGRVAVEAIAEELRVQGPPADQKAVDVIIVGSGPAGLSAGLQAMKSGLSYLVLEQGTVADTVRKYPRHKILMAEPVRIPFYGDLWVKDASKETLLETWERIIQNTGLEVRSGQQVTEVTRSGSLLAVKAAGQTYLGRRVVLAMGRRGTPRKLGVPGEQLEKVLYNIVEMEAFEGQAVLVVGGGDSALESALGLAEQEGTKVTLCHRKDTFERVADRNREKIIEAAERGKVHLLLNSQVREIHGDRVELEVNGAPLTIQNDAVIIRVGGEPPLPFLQRIGVEIVKKEVADEPVPAEAQVG